ncbi:MAG: flagellar motor switch protein FliN [Moorella sp. (in: firmicutes)]|jgi:flagellar motor switch protein FliN/FliY|uniref:flagellar motor switch protein FliN n=1 Tax=unclassified Neomoorella TaxID=2676739 RepID=UPI0010FFC492|nr:MULTISPECIES: flagellar motor switch protein FliN [unclassified Moorella (in: firmicutes)]MDK2816024.1 flagellar motor switch protein FliN [Moorella sp. (in: firmicutes)]MDK2894798.1 flagellar motor switch protein FliN [Moorella sp. (in: firmicutes)]GEA16659.1 flagellar motor switch protein FliN [Moorella sp. E308F]GEA17152.1 flagellar motor switch protein FliN [Moorella sp. E306M]
MPLTDEEIQKLLEAMAAGEDRPRIEKARFAPLQPAPVARVKASFDRIADVPLRLVAELGRTRLAVKEILELKEGSVITLNKLAGEAVEVRVNGIPLATGEVVVINDAFGVRINNLADVKEEGQD